MHNVASVVFSLILQFLRCSFFSRLFSAIDILLIIPTNMVGPFMYLLDLIKDSLQFTILLISIGNIQNVIQNPTSFSSAVSNIIFVFIGCPNLGHFSCLTLIMWLGYNLSKNATNV